MPINPEDNLPPQESPRIRDTKNILILAVICLIIGLYLMFSAVMVSKDAVTFIDYAKAMRDNPLETIRSQDQHPGYPWLISRAHRLAQIINFNDPLYSWIFTAQAVSLLFRILAIIPLYYLAKLILEERYVFWAMLILFLAPDPAKYGSDALSDWPNLFFLSSALTLLLFAIRNKRVWPYPLIGLLTGMGYLIRPECAQVVLYAGAWLGLTLIWKKYAMTWAKTVLAGLVAVLFFLIPAAPYMMAKGAVFPKKNVLPFAETSLNIPHLPVSHSHDDTSIENSPAGCLRYTAGINFKKIGDTSWKIAENISQTLLWFFAFPLAFALLRHFIFVRRLDPERIFLLMVILLNITIMAWLYTRYGYLDRRHTLVLSVLGCLLVPIGLDLWARSLERIFTPHAHLIKSENVGQFWFFLLLMIGFIFYLPNLYRPIHFDKLALKNASEWLMLNSSPEDKIALCGGVDGRVTFYARRNGIDCDSRNIPADADIVVTTMPESRLPEYAATLQESWPFKYGRHVLIYRPASQAPLQ